jgi:hypothetical protein
MTKLLITHTRDDTTKPWIIVNQQTTHSDMFTPQEIDVLISTKTVIDSLPGYLGSTESFPDDNTYVIEMKFDTLTNAQNAKQIIDNPPENSLWTLRRLLLKNKRTETLGESYIVITSIIE